MFFFLGCELIISIIVGLFGCDIIDTVMTSSFLTMVSTHGMFIFFITLFYVDFFFLM